MQLNYSEDIENLKNRVDDNRRVLGHVLHLLEKMNQTMEDGFANVNERLSKLEGKEGMQGVNSQLSDIKTEIGKIQKAYPYEELFSNLHAVSKNGEA